MGMALVVIIVLLIVGGIVYYSASNQSKNVSNPNTEYQSNASIPSGTVTKKENNNIKAGIYELYDPKFLANAATGKVVLFFHAPWCPTCQALDADIRAHLNDIPPDVTILETDYDTQTALKQKYGITIQGTFVQVDQNGNKLNRWGNNNTYTLADLLSNVK